MICVSIAAHTKDNLSQATGTAIAAFDRVTPVEPSWSGAGNIRLFRNHTSPLTYHLPWCSMDWDSYYACHIILCLQMPLFQALWTRHFTSAIMAFLSIFFVVAMRFNSWEGFVMTFFFRTLFRVMYHLENCWQHDISYISFRFCFLPRFPQWKHRLNWGPRCTFTGNRS